MRKSLPEKFNKQAESYNKRRNSDKTFKYRQKIYQDIEGEVLEVGIGVGLNFPFYKKEVELQQKTIHLPPLLSREMSSLLNLQSTVLTQSFLPVPYAVIKIRSRY